MGAKSMCHNYCMTKMRLLAVHHQPSPDSLLLSDYPSLQVEVPKSRGRVSVADDMQTLFDAHDQSRGMLVNRAHGSWGFLAAVGLLRTVAQYADYGHTEDIRMGASASEFRFSDRALVTVPHPGEYPGLLAGVLAYRQAALGNHPDRQAMEVPVALTADVRIAEALAAVEAAQPQPATPLDAARLAMSHVAERLV